MGEWKVEYLTVGSGRYGVCVKHWEECDGKTWDGLNESQREILMLRDCGGCVLVRLVGESYDD